MIQKLREKVAKHGDIMEDEELENFDNELMFKCSEDMKPN